MTTRNVLAAATLAAIPIVEADARTPARSGVVAARDTTTRGSGVVAAP